MRKITHEGVTGIQFENFEEAWSHYLEVTWGDAPMPSEIYHQSYRAFLQGAMVAMNIASVKFNDMGAAGVSVEESIGRCFIETLKDISAAGVDEYKRKRGQQ